MELSPRDASLDNPLADCLESLKKMFSDAGLQFPVVVKPTHGAGKMFVRRVNDYIDLLDVIYNFVLYNLEYKARFFLSRDEAEGIFVEELMDGIEVDVDCLVQKVCSAYNIDFPLLVGFI